MAVETFQHDRKFLKRLQIHEHVNHTQNKIFMCWLFSIFSCRVHTCTCMSKMCKCTYMCKSTYISKISRPLSKLSTDVEIFQPLSKLSTIIETLARHKINTSYLCTYMYMYMCLCTTASNDFDL